LGISNNSHKVMNKLIPIIILLFFSVDIHSQKLRNPEYTVRGSLKDNTGAVIPYGNILLYNSADSAFISGTTGDENGKFELKTTPGKYYVKISFISYQSKTIPDLTVQNKDVDLGKIVLSDRIEMMEEVVISGQKSQFQLELDKKVFNVGSDITSMGGSAADLLNNVPSVAVEMDGSVTLRGSQNVIILVDGKPSGLTGLRSPDALRQLQGDIIEKVEVITNPSAKFDATGEVGIINLVLKKNTRQGLNGTFTANGGYPLLLEGSYSINYRKNKLNFFSNFGITQHTDKSKGETYQKYAGTDTSFMFLEKTRGERKSFSQNFNFGIDYYFSEKSSLTGSFIYERSNEKNQSTIDYRDYSIDKVFLQSTSRNETETANENNLETALSYKKKFSLKGQELTADFKWIQTTEPELSDIRQFNSEGESILNEKGGTGENEFNYLLQSDYVQPFMEFGRIETGIKSNLRIVNSEYFYKSLNNAGLWIDFPAFTNNLEYYEKISAAYLQASYEIKPFAFQAGLRGEYSDITTDLTKTSERNHRSYLDLFPSANMSYRINDRNTIQVSYSRRLNRPNFRDLLPYNGFGDSRILMQGNPDLNPEYTNSYESGYLLDNEFMNLMTTVYYRHRTGVIQRFATIDENGVTHIKPINISVQNAYGLEGNLGLELNKVVDITSNFNFYKAISVGKYETKDFSTTTYSWTNRSALSLKLGQIDMQATFNYRAPRVTPQGRDLSSWYTDFGVRKELFKGKGRLGLNVRDLFNSRKRISIVDSDGLYSRSENQFRMRQILLTFSYRLNKDNKGEDHGEREDGNGGGEEY
jgi:outer membrane receptor protein involved in Fe transport